MRIAGLEKFSTVDFPGSLAAVLFAAGCNYRCFYCHNRHILGEPPLLPEAEVLAFLQKRAGLLDGVVFSGGEPTLQSDLPEWVRRVRALGYKTKLDTNGSRPEVLRALIADGLLDYVAMDYKAPLEGYSPLCNADSAGVPESLALLRGSGVPYELRTTLVPQITEAKLRRMAAAVPADASWFLQLYRPQPGDEAQLCGLAPYTPGEIEALAETLRRVRPNVKAR